MSSHRSKIIKEWLDIQVTAANQTYKETFEVDKHAKKIIGFAISTNQDGLMYFRGSQRIVINEVEIYPEGYESKMLMQGFNINVNERIKMLEEEMEPGNREVELDFTDTDHPSMAFQPYRVRLYVYSKLDE
ncbi:MAG: hypothetical protein ACXVNO_01445 [Bacteroidia bacterium]